MWRSSRKNQLALITAGSQPVVRIPKESHEIMPLTFAKTTWKHRVLIIALMHIHYQNDGSQHEGRVTQWEHSF